MSPHSYSINHVYNPPFHGRSSPFGCTVLHGCSITKHFTTFVARKAGQLFPIEAGNHGTRARHLNLQNNVFQLRASLEGEVTPAGGETSAPTSPAYRLRTAYLPLLAVSVRRFRAYSSSWCPILEACLFYGTTSEQYEAREQGRIAFQGHSGITHTPTVRGYSSLYRVSFPTIIHLPYLRFHQTNPVVR